MRCIDIYQNRIRSSIFITNSLYLYAYLSAARLHIKWSKRELVFKEIEHSFFFSFFFYINGLNHDSPCSHWFFNLINSSVFCLLHSGLNRCIVNRHKFKMQTKYLVTLMRLINLSFYKFWLEWQNINSKINKMKASEASN